MSGSTGTMMGTSNYSEPPIYDGHNLFYQSSETFSSKYAINFQSKFPLHCTTACCSPVQCRPLSILPQTRYHQDQLTKVSVNISHMNIMVWF